MPLRPWTAAMAVSLLLAAPAGAVERTLSTEAQRGLTLTVYQNGLALVHDRRWAPLVAGRNDLQIEGLSERLILGSLRVYSSEAGVGLVARSFRPADLSPDRLLEAMVGRRVLYVTAHPQTGEETVRPARLLSLNGGAILEIDGRVEINPPGRIALDALPEPDGQALRAEAALEITLDSTEARPTELTLGYLTEGLSWHADYVADLAPDGTVDLTAHVTLDNDLQTRFAFSDLRLVAGEVSRKSAAPPMMARGQAESMMAMDVAMAPAPIEVGDRYLYDTGLEITLEPGERKQVALFQISGIAAERRYSFDGLAGLGGPDQVGPVQATLELVFDNPERDQGEPLPAGSIRVYEALDEGEGQPVFSGEANIGHTPVGGEVELSLGRAFDVTAEARRTDFERLGDRAFEAGQEIQVTNAKSEPLEVEVIGRFPRGTEILEESLPHEQTTAERLTWTVTVPANGTATLTYRARVQN
ncbi:hypothetical protein ABWI00_15915 [Algihabitans albus]|uniref:DUF4139 domain-containing protein n=1 Tax=Algihabitans albus TaxID=2164067 RepID=UPI0035CF9383